MNVYFPKGTYLVDTLSFAPTEYIPVKIFGAGKSSTFVRKRQTASNTSVLEIGNNPSTHYRGEIEIADMTIDGYDGTGSGLVLYEVWYSTVRNVRVSNCDIGIVCAAAIYIDFYSPDITWNRIGVDVSNFAGSSFPDTGPAMLNFYGGVIWRNSQAGINADYFNEINTFGTGFEKNGTAKTATHGAIITGANVNRNGLSNGVSMLGGWVEDNSGIAQLQFGSGLNSVDRVRFWQADGIVDYSMRFTGGKYQVNACTIPSSTTSLIKEENGVSTGNYISQCTGFSYQINQSKTGVSEGASARYPYLTVGGSDMGNPSMIIQNANTYFQFVIEGSVLKLKNGSTEIDHWPK